ncbi:MAG: glycoside hydrolase family 36 protein [Candidatus Limnocylindria bacterium]
MAWHVADDDRLDYLRRTGPSDDEATTTEIQAVLEIDPASARVHEHGWQSWTPASTYGVNERPHRRRTDRNAVMHTHGGSMPPRGFSAAGLLAVDPGNGAPIHVFAARDGRRAVPTTSAERSGDRLVVRADGPVDHLEDAGPGGIEGALARWSDNVVAGMQLPPPRPAPTAWCSWYHYFTEVTEADIDENLAAMEELDLPIEVVQLDDGYQAEVGDWVTLSDRFASLEAMARRIHASGRRAGIWIAPFLVGERSELARRHPDWLVQSGTGPTDAGWNWDEDLAALDVTHPAAAAYLADVLGTMRGWGFDFFKVDFVYAGALDGQRNQPIDGLEAYRIGMELIREAIGDAYLLGCGAPILPSIGLVDAMRVSPDTAPTYEPSDGSLSEPEVSLAIVTGVARAFQHGRFWINDADCLIVRPEVERREEWADHVGRYSGLRSSSDRLRSLDAWGLETTRRLLSEPPPPRFVDS